jgi:hypothetical protein
VLILHGQNNDNFSGAPIMRELDSRRNEDLGVIVALLNRFSNDRLPYARQLKVKVDRGALLSPYDLRFLQRVFEESAHARRLAARHGKYESLVSQATSLYGEIVRKCLENEQAASKRTPRGSSLITEKKMTSSSRRTIGVEGDKFIVGQDDH